MSSARFAKLVNILMTHTLFHEINFISYRKKRKLQQKSSMKVKPLMAIRKTSLEQCRMLIVHDTLKLLGIPGGRKKDSLSRNIR